MSNPTRLKKWINGAMSGENPQNCRLVVEKRLMRLSLCANGTLAASAMDRYLKELEDSEGVIVGEFYLSNPSNMEMLNEAREYVVSQEQVDMEFVASSNRVQQSGILD